MVLLFLGKPLNNKERTSYGKMGVWFKMNYKEEKAIIEKKAVQLYVMEGMSGEKVVMN